LAHTWRITVERLEECPFGPPFEVACGATGSLIGYLPF